MEGNRPRGREQNITGKGKDVYIHGEGLGTGPVGNSGGYQGRPGAQKPASSPVRPAGTNTGSGGTRASGGRSPLLIIIILAVLLLGGGGAGLSGLFGGGTTTAQPSVTLPPASSLPTPKPAASSSYSGSTGSYSGGQTLDLASLLGGLSAGNSSTGWTQKANTGTLNTAVAAGARAKRTEILGGGRDTVTIMVYMCGTDLESRSGMGTSDLQEMASAQLGSNVNLLVYTGGCRQWNNNVVSNSVNQIY